MLLNLNYNKDRNYYWEQYMYPIKISKRWVKYAKRIAYKNRTRWKMKLRNITKFVQVIWGCDSSRNARKKNRCQFVISSQYKKCKKKLIFNLLHNSKVKPFRSYISINIPDFILLRIADMILSDFYSFNIRPIWFVRIFL